MANLNSAIVLLPCAVFVFLLPVISGDLISETCSQTPNEHLCVTTLRRDSRSRGADIAGLALIMVDALQEKANATLQYIKGVQKSNLNLANALMVCNENYVVMQKIDIPKASGHLKQSPRLAEHGMADAVIEAEECDSSFDEPMEPRLSELNSVVHDLSNVALSMIRTMLHMFN